MDPVAPPHVGSSQTRARTHVPCIGRQILNHCATRETQLWSFLTAASQNKYGWCSGTSPRAPPPPTVVCRWLNLSLSVDLQPEVQISVPRSLVRVPQESQSQYVKKSITRSFSQAPPRMNGTPHSNLGELSCPTFKPPK